MQLRYVIPRFDGDDAQGTMDAIKAILDAHGTERIRIHKGFGVFTFSIPGSYNAETMVFNSLFQALKGVNAKCSLWSYSKLNKTTCDSRKE